MYTYHGIKITRMHDVVSPTGAQITRHYTKKAFDKLNFFNLFPLHLIGAILCQGALFPPPFACILFPCFPLSLDVLSMPVLGSRLFCC